MCATWKLSMALELKSCSQNNNKWKKWRKQKKNANENMFSDDA